MCTRSIRRVVILILALGFLHAPVLCAQNWSRDWEIEEMTGVTYTSVATGMTSGGTTAMDGTREPLSSRSREDYESAATGIPPGILRRCGKGEQDYRKTPPPELRRHERYRDADHGYKSRTGPNPSIAMATARDSRRLPQGVRRLAKILAEEPRAGDRPALLVQPETAASRIGASARSARTSSAWSSVLSADKTGRRTTTVRVARLGACYRVLLQERHIKRKPLKIASCILGR